MPMGLQRLQMNLAPAATPTAAPQYLPPEPALGAITVDSTARWFGTDRKTFLLLAGAGILGGWWLHSLSLAAKRAGRRARRRVKALTPRNKIALSGVAVAGLAVAAGAAWWYYNQPSAAPRRVLAAKPPARAQRQLPQKAA